MRRSPSGAAELARSLLAVIAWLAGPSTMAQTSTGPAAPARPDGARTAVEVSSHTLGSVADYLAAFARAYEPSVYDATMLLEAEAAAHRAGLATAPDITFQQTLAWSAFDSFSLDLEAELRLPLYDSLAGPNLALADADLTAAAAAAAAARADASLAFFADLATYATLTEASTGMASALASFRDAPWHIEDDLDPLHLAPADRGPYEAHQRLLGMNAFLIDQRHEVARRMARLLGREEDELAAPSSAAVRAAVPAPPDSDGCLARSPAVAAARLRHRQASLVAALDVVPTVTVFLTGDFGVTLAEANPSSWGSPSPAPTASFALEARVALPSSRSPWHDVGAVVTAVVSPSGASQSLRIGWPRPPLTVTVPTDLDAELADELERVAADQRTLRRALDQAAAERARLERALGWLLLDSLASTGSWDQVENRLPVERALPGPLPQDVPATLVAQAADLRTQLAFAQLDEVIALSQLASACGAWP